MRFRINVRRGRLGRYVPAGPSTTASLTPSSVAANSGWTAVGAATLSSALAAGDSDYITASTASATATIELTNPAATILSLTAGAIVIRHRIATP